VTGARVERGFVRIDAGLIHYRYTAPPASGAKTPLLMAHGGPGSSAGLSPLIAALGVDRQVIAPDMMGNGESDPPPEGPTSIAFYAACLNEVATRLGLETLDLYGHHTGAQVVCEFALAHPDRVERLVLDGVGLFPEALRAEFLELYAPPLTPDLEGSHMQTLWAFMAELSQHFPHYRRDPEHAVKAGRPPPPAALTDRFAEVAKVWSTYHLSYEAAFRHDLATRLKLLPPSTLILAVEGDPLEVYATRAAALIRGAKVIPATREDRPRTVRALLDN
jgi:pimeloyl-ACP methyl ester carboxylesterase